jgi:hypothetical protein
VNNASDRRSSWYDANTSRALSEFAVKKTHPSKTGLGGAPGLKIHPELRRHTKIFTEAERDVCADGPLFAHDLVDSREVQGLRQLVRRNPHRLHEFRP